MIKNRKTNTRRLEKATEHVSSMWFPFNRDLLQAMRQKHTDGVYKSNINLLVEDLRSDFALFTFVIKNLIPAATQENVNEEIIQNPMQLISWAGSDRVCSLIQDDSKLPNSHILETLEPFQAERLRETTIVASTAEILSEQNNLDAQEGFCQGIIREIGLNLIAWNYPTLYARVIKSLPEDVSLEQRLTEELGFSPGLLAIRVLNSSNSEPSETSNQQESVIPDTYAKLCEVGEALARAEHPDRYPSAENDWELAQTYLKKTLGERGVEIIRNRAMERSEHYQNTLSDVFTSLEQFNPGESIKNYRKRKAAKKNKYLAQCTPQIQAALKSLYSHIGNIAMTRDVLESLVQTVIPSAGFTGGCVFIIDPTSISLAPRSVFGTVRLRDIRPVTLNVATAEQDTNILYTENIIYQNYGSDLAASALACSHPVIARSEQQEEGGITGMYGSLGEARKVGVLYLESLEKSHYDEEQQDIITFKAMRQALADALYLD